jgi:hypothetical protein
MTNNNSKPKAQPAVHYGADAQFELQRNLKCDACGAQLRVIDCERLPDGCQLICGCGELVFRFIPRTIFPREEQ